jgi:hypothetical protein
VGDHFTTASAEGVARGARVVRRRADSSPDTWPAVVAIDAAGNEAAAWP